VLATSGGSFGVSAIVLVAFAGYVFVSERAARRMTVGLEKRLRLSLLVHNMELENMAMQDDLTQLFNRRYFFDRLERELETAKAFNRPLSVMVIDLDGMKQVNDGSDTARAMTFCPRSAGSCSLRRGRATCRPGSAGMSSRSSCRIRRTSPLLR
jgi:hypothetical protein